MITVDCSSAVKALGLLWSLLPLAAAVASLLVPRGGDIPIVEEGRTSYHFMAAVGGGWMLLGLALVPFLGVHGTSLAKALLMAVGWSAVVGAWYGPAVVERIYRPPPSAIGEPVEFKPIGGAGNSTELSPTSGDAASARFLVPKGWWLDAYTRAGNKPVKGRVYKGGRNLWFARFD